ncbi:glycogen synthase GlgA [Lactiplantibacillus modestisalitolerans]|uniref:Glycogen synthase n=1 Tax=Lactiplantibacillus modestisalitolerans TaxID=1457219 RepID=A0ABV5WSI6_9LACO|nr:glycogen synthase GlgA [Lactiplantibacillus modestisalitolerans]
MTKQTKVLFATAEAAPFYKTGGLGDVSLALPRALHAQGLTVRVVVPFYQQRFPAQYQSQLRDLTHFTVQVGVKRAYCGVKTLTLAGIRYYLIDNLDYFGRPNLYGYWDDGERYAFFQMAICEMLERIHDVPDILHLNDWHTAFIPVLLSEKYYWIEAYQRIRTVLTIHNLQFQGRFDPVILDSLFRIGIQTFNEQGIADGGLVSFLKAGINFADALTTVSPAYAQEIQTPAYGEGLDATLRAKRGRLWGILNGIDTASYDPALAVPYSAATLDRRRQNRAALQRTVGLPVRSVPVMAVVSRLTDQKGMSLLLDALDPVLKAHDVQLVVLGTGAPALEHAFQIYQLAYPTKVAVKLRFDERLAQQIYGGSDLFLMPSAFEPCGLSQLMAMRYGCLPLVHAVGGLRDTVVPYNRYTGAGTGFSFEDFRPAVLQRQLTTALQLVQRHPRVWRRLQRQAMATKMDWQRAAARYGQLYQTLLHGEEE